jgi:amino acid permease
MPWAMERAGIIPAISLLLGMAAISFYTAYRILDVFENNGTDTSIIYEHGICVEGQSH